MKVGIFGDSFADPYNKMIDHLAWPILLKSKYDVNVWAKAGSSIYYTYKNFMEHHMESDINVVVITDLCRYTKSVSFKSQPGREWYIAGSVGINHVRRFVKDMTPSERLELNKIQASLEVMDLDFMKDMKELMVNEITRVCPLVIIIEVMRDHINDPIPSVNNVSMVEIFNTQLTSLGMLTDVPFKKDKNTLCDENYITCHFTDAVNEFVADSVDNSIKLGKWHCVLPEKIEHPHPWDHYYRVQK